MIAVPILTKTIHATHDWQPLPAAVEAYKCSKCGALKAVKFGFTRYTVADCEIGNANHWYQAKQQCYTWGVKTE